MDLYYFFMLGNKSHICYIDYVKGSNILRVWRRKNMELALSLTMQFNPQL